MVTLVSPGGRVVSVDADTAARLGWTEKVPAKAPRKQAAKPAPKAE